LGSLAFKPSPTTAQASKLGSKASSSHPALESTGRFSRLICQLAQEAGLIVYLLNALDVHHCAKAMG
jgi:hypothetical protein